jgi:preprotein translocase subunit SecF
VRFFKSVNIDFIGNRRKFFAVAVLLLLMTIAAFIYRGGPNFGIDFTGGILMQISFGDKTPALHNIRSAIEEAGVKSFELQSLGNFILIRAKETLSSQEEFKNLIKDSLQAKFPNSSVKAERVEYVGPAVGKHLSKQAVYAFLFAFLGMIVYVAFRFKSSLWGISAVLGVIHDVIACFGFVILVGKEVDITVIAALLTLAGYSINDTIVLFDRIKENLRMEAKENFATIINKGINEVLVRTVVTSLTVFIVGSSLFFFGGEALHTFAYIMVIGAVLGVFSSVFICAPLVYEWEIRRNNRLKAAIKQGKVSLK